MKERENKTPHICDLIVKKRKKEWKQKDSKPIFCCWKYKLIFLLIEKKYS